MAKVSNILSNPDEAPLLEQLAGVGKGRRFELSIDEIRIGREDENDIVIADESVSRLHAKIERGPDGSFVISDNQSKNGIYVNKSKVTSVPLSHGDIIQMGHFVFRFKIPGMSSPSLSVPNSKPDLSMGVNSNLKVNNGNRKRLYLWVGVLIVIGLLWALTNQDSTKTEPVKKVEKPGEEKFKPSEAPEFDESMKSTMNSNLEDPITKTEKEVVTLENKENSVKESELYFRKGQRDYFNKNYHHAIDNFDAALSIWNKHPLAGYYKGLAVHESEVEAQKNREIGLKYFNSLQYNRAIYHFKAAIDFLSHVNTENAAAKRSIQECERYLELSKRKLKAMELVP